MLAWSTEHTPRGNTTEPPDTDPPAEPGGWAAGNQMTPRGAGPCAALTPLPLTGLRGATDPAVQARITELLEENTESLCGPGPGKSFRTAE